MFVFSDPSLLEAVIAAHKRGVNVRVHAQPERRDGEKENGECRISLGAAGVEVRDSNPAFDLTHEKSMVIDDSLAFVASLNWQTRNLTETRDYAILTSHKHEVDEIIQGFDADWERTEFTPGDHSHLIWCIGNGRQRLGKLIDGAKHSLFLQNERYQDPPSSSIWSAPMSAASRSMSWPVPLTSSKRTSSSKASAALRILQDLGRKDPQA